MSKFIIKGEKRLNGVIEIGGMKNAATPILAATLLTDQECVINNVPQITDVDKMLLILKSLGSKIERLGPHQVSIKNDCLNFKSLDQKLVKNMRSSVLFLAPMLARFQSVDLPEPGGCIIGSRPLDTHFSALEPLGVKIERQKSAYHFEAKQLKGNEIVLSEFSVTATENALMAAVLAQGKTTIKIAATEPHVQDLCVFLNKMGAKISGIGTHILEINGVKKLQGAQHNLISDYIEAFTYAMAGILTRGKIEIKNIIPQHADFVALKLQQINVNFEIKNNSLVINPSIDLRAFKLQTLPYPGFPTDLQAIFGLLATQCKGTSLIHETLYENRFNYFQELIKMGANAIVADPHRVIVNGPTPLYGQEIKSFDLRAGATLIMAGLIAQGETIINDVEVVDRGYEGIEEKLKSLGAEIRRIN